MATATQAIGMVEAGQTGFGSLATLCEMYMPLVRQVARKIHRTLPTHVELEDLVSAGTLGLLGAAETFRSDFAVEFGAFARFRVRGAILDTLREYDWAPRHLRRQSRAIQKAIATLEATLGRAPEEAEIAAHMEMGVGALQKTFGDLHALEVGSLQEHVGEGEEMLLEYVADETDPGALALVLEGEMKEALTQAIEALPERERLVVALSYFEELTLKEIGQVLGIGESRVSQLRSAAVLRLRTALRTF